MSRDRLRLWSAYTLGGVAATLLAAVALGALWYLRYVPDEGQGWQATYFVQPDFSGDAYERVDGALDFTWGGKGPALGVPFDAFSATWKACLHVTRFEQALAVNSDGAVAILIDGEPYLWVESGSLVGEPSLAPGEHDVEVRYEHGSGEASIRLAWPTWGGFIVTVPPAVLRPAPCADRA